MIQGTIRRVGRKYIVRPDPFVLEYADNVAAVRQGTAYLKNRVNKVVIGSFDRFLALNRQGARCETAVKILLNPIRWWALAEKLTHLPDLGLFVDVKGRAKAWHEMPVQTDDEDEFAFVLVTAENDPDFVVHGWLWGWEAKKHPLKDPDNRGSLAHFVDQDALRDTDELIAIIHPDRKRGIA